MLTLVRENFPPSQGVYTLIIHVRKAEKLNVGRLGLHYFPVGYYTYTGSALGKSASNLRNRLTRHLTRRKKLCWHIDYLLNAGSAETVAVCFAKTSERMECLVSTVLKMLPKATIPVRGFGSTDCISGCPAHLQLFIHKNPISVVRAVSTAYKKVGLVPNLVALRASGDLESYLKVKCNIHLSKVHL
jgi:sugar fermentation stimulation protein A